MVRRLCPLAPILLAFAATLSTEAAPLAVYDAGTVAGREVMTAPANGRKVVVRTAGLPEDAYLLSASPDGGRIALLLLEDLAGTRGALLVGRARGGRFAGASDGLVGRPLAHAWSPDGRTLWFEHRDFASGRSDVYRLDVRTRRRTSLTGDLVGSASPSGDSTELRAGPGGAVAFLFDFPERRGLLVARGGLPEDAAAGLGAGAPGEDFAFLDDGTLLFRFVPEGETLGTLYLRGAETVPVADAVASFAAAGAWYAALRPAGLRASGPAGDYAWEPAERIAGFRLAADGRALAVHAPEAGGARIFLVEGGAATELLAGHALAAVEDLRFVPDSRAVLAVVQEAGARRLYHLDPATGEELEPAAGMGGKLGAFVGLSPGGDLVVFAVLADDGLSGSLVAWSPADGLRRDLSEAAGVPTVPGEAVFSPGGSEVLYSLRWRGLSEPRLFLWTRRSGRITPVSLPGFPVGRFLLSRRMN